MADDRNKYFALCLTKPSNTAFTSLHVLSLYLSSISSHVVSFPFWHRDFTFHAAIFKIIMLRLVAQWRSSTWLSHDCHMTIPSGWCGLAALSDQTTMLSTALLKVLLIKHYLEEVHNSVVSLDLMPVVSLFSLRQQCICKWVYMTCIHNGSNVRVNIIELPICKRSRSSYHGPVQPIELWFPSWNNVGAMNL